MFMDNFMYNIHKLISLKYENTMALFFNIV